MRRTTRLLAIAVLGLALFATTATAASAQEGDETDQRHRPGALWAKGTGEVHLDVHAARLGIRVSGDVTIVGPADLDVRINSVEQARAADGGQTIIVLEDFTGRIAVQGQDFTVDIEGEVYLHGVGSGHASFVGEGWWKTRHRRGLWPAAEPQTDIEFGDEI